MPTRTRGMCWGKNVANGRLESPGGHDYHDGGDNNDDDGDGDDGGEVGDDDNDDCQGVEGNLGAGTPVAGTEGNSFKKQKAINLKLEICCRKIAGFSGLAKKKIDLIKARINRQDLAWTKISHEKFRKAREKISVRNVHRRFPFVKSRW